MKFLTYFQDKKSGVYFKYLLESTFNCDVNLVESMNDFSSELNSIGNYQFVLFSSNEIHSENYLIGLKEQMSSIPNILSTRDNVYKLLVDLPNVQLFLQDIAKKLNVPYFLNETISSFVPVRPEYLVRVEFAACDLYIKLSDEKYLKIFKKDNAITTEELIRIQKKNFENLYVKVVDYELFLSSIDAFSGDYNKETNPNASTEIVKDLTFAHDVFYQISSKLGLNDKSIIYANKSVELLYELIEQEESLKAIWKTLMKNKNFLSEHSLMTGYLANAILSHTSYFSDNNSIKLSVASVLHDVSLKDEKHHNFELNEKLLLDYSRREVDSFKVHVLNSAELLNKFEDVPLDIDKIILQHHEKYDGSGFPRGIGWSNIPLLSSIFIVAHEFVIYALDKSYDELALNKFVADKKLEYKEGYFKEAIIALEKIRL